MATKHNSKKRFLEPDTDNSAPNRGFSLLSNDDWPKFITIESISSDIPITKLSPFAIQKGIAGIAGTVKEVKKLRSGQILVECCKKANAENLLHANMLAGVQIKTSPHPTLNYSKGIIRTRELDDVDEEEITNELKTQGVTNVKRIIIKREERMIKTNTYIITFNKPLLPERIQIGYLSVPVDLYIPNPLRCFNCQKYGHGFNSCKNKHICCNCGEEGHDKGSCEKPTKCCNCTGDHSAASKQCPMWIKEKEIQKIRCTKRISYIEAKKQVTITPIFTLNKTFASAARKSVRTVDCQTDITWMYKDKPQIVNLSNTPSRAKITEKQNEVPSNDTNLSQISETENQRTSKSNRKSNSQSKVSQEETSKTRQIKDAEMKESEHHSRSPSPKGKVRTNVPVLPNR